jgi:hypothetical protein
MYKMLEVVYLIIRFLINGEFLKWKLFRTSQPERCGFLRVAHVSAYQSVVKPPKHFVFEEIRSPLQVYNTKI